MNSLLKVWLCWGFISLGESYDNDSPNDLMMIMMNDMVNDDDNNG